MRRVDRLIHVAILILALPLSLALAGRLLGWDYAIANRRAQSIARATSSVAIIKVEQPRASVEVEEAVRRAVALALDERGLDELVRPGDTVLLKPNLGLGLDAHEITSWAVVRAVALLCHEAGAGTILVAEGPNLGLAHFAQAGYSADVPGLEFLDLSAVTTPRLSLTIPDTLWSVGEPIVLPRPYVQANVLITIPKLKTHSSTGMTGALKNAVGAAPLEVYSSSDGLGWRDRFHWYYGIHKSIVQINLARPPDLAVIDAVLAGEGLGPWGASPVEMGLVLASADPVAADAAAAALMGLEPERIRHLVYAEARGLGLADLEHIAVRGTSIEEARRPFALPGRDRTLYRKTIVLGPPPPALMLDGDPHEWGAYRRMALQEREIIVGHNSWTSTDDAGLYAWAAYDQERLYVAIEVHDDALRPGEHNTVGNWEGDALELCFSGANQDEGGRAPAYSGHDARLGLGYGQDALVRLPDGTSITAEIHTAPQPYGYTTELAIPFSELGRYRPMLHGEIGLDVILWDQDAPETEPTGLGWSGSIAVLDDPREMGVALLEADAPTSQPTHMPLPTASATSTPIATATVTPSPLPSATAIPTVPPCLPCRWLLPLVKAQQ
ncbi:MAG: DUF362 domain-containing protein [Chloroflexi bacterium]|nr:DUF362 domain-containing protein [Chloroflexota bacterium]